MSKAVFPLVAVAALLSCAVNPVTGKRELALVSEAQEVEMGKQYAQQVLATMGPYPDEALQAYVRDIGMKMAAKSQRPNLPWQFHVVNDATVNAFALPGGPVFITRGILAHMNSEAELAAVMGHEIGHITARHSVRQISKAQLAQVGLGVGMILRPELQGALGQLAGAGMQLLFLKYGRDAEKQSDDLGYQYMIQQGYDPREMTDMFATLQRVGAGAGGGRVPEWMSTHPDPENRVKANQERLAKSGNKFEGTKVGAEEFGQKLQNLVYGEDPRQGYFQGSTFLHPDMKFQINFPAGWQTANMPEAVVGLSPGKDAMLQLASAGQLSPMDAAKKFFSQEGVKQGQAAQGTIHGNAAISSYFAAQTQEGVLEGLVTFVQYGGQTFAIFGYTPQGKLQSYDAAIRGSMGSFAALSDPNALNVQPARLQVVRIDRDMTVEQFAAQYPSTAPVDQLALINGVEKGGTLKAGTPVKRVVGGQPQTSTKPPGQSPQ